MVKNLPANAGSTGDARSIPVSTRSPRVGNGNPPQYSCLGNPMDRGAWWAIVRGVTKSQTWLSTRGGRGDNLSSVFSHVRPFASRTAWTTARQAFLSITNSWSFIRFMSIESVMPSNRLILCCPLLLLPSIFPSMRVFSNESVLHIRWPKDLSFSFSISPSNEYSGLISFRIDWLDLLAGQGTLKSLLQHHSSKASILWHSAFFTVPSLTSIHDHWKNHSLD